MLDPFHLQTVNKLYRKHKPVRIIQKEHLLILGTRKLPKNLNIYLRNHQTETTIFLATKHEKAITMAKNGGFCFFLSENDFETVLVNFCCYEHGANASEAVQKISTSTRTLLEVCQLTKTANFKAIPMKKHLASSLLPVYWRYKPGFCFFPDK